MKKIEDYLHLYLGCECLWEDKEGDTGGRTELDHYSLSGFYEGDIKIKPLLRPLSDMTEEEARYIFKYYFEKDYTEDWTGDTGSAYFNPKRITPTKYHALRIIDGADYETGDFMKVIGLVPYLLSKHFDLFGLIESGLAIDKTTLNKCE